MSSPKPDAPDPATDLRAALVADLIAALRINSGHAVLLHTRIGERLGLGASDHKALDLIQRFGPMTAGQLAERTGLTSGAITGMLDRLEQAGYARRAKDLQDRRKVVIEPTPERLPEIDRLFGTLSQQTESLLNHYSDAELHLILDFLQRSNAVMDAQPDSGGV